MKSMLKTSAIRFAMIFGLAMTVTVQALAGGGAPRLTFKPVPSTKKVSMVLEGLATKATLQVRDAKGQVLMTERIKNVKSFERILSLENLDAGAYLIVLATPMQDILQPLEITENGLVINEAKQKAYFAPAVRVNGKIVDINLLNSRISDVELMLFDSNGQPVYKENLQNIIKVQKRLNMTELPAGLYTLKVVTPYKAYYRDVSIK